MLPFLPLLACQAEPAPPEERTPAEEAPMPAEDPTAAARGAMVERQIAARGLTDPEVLRAMRAVPRHRFVDPAQAGEAYADYPLPIAQEQTISQPYIVALMTDLADVAAGERVLEVGTGSGYQAAVLAELGAEVYSVEILPELSASAKIALEATGYADKVKLRVGDGYAGWPEAAPFDAVIVTAAPPSVPPPLQEQLKVGGKLVIPVGDDAQELLVFTREPGGAFARDSVVPVRFVPMTGRAQEGQDGP